MSTPPLGWIAPQDRTIEQQNAHAAAEANMPQFAMPGFVEPPAGTKIMLSDFWDDPAVVADCGFTFDRSPFHQITGSCVGAGGGNALFALIAVQRMIATAPTKAILPFWPFSYGRCRFLEGDRGQGEGAMGSAFAEQVRKEGVIDIREPGLTAFKNTDGLTLTKQQELQWSDGGSSLVTKYLNAAKAHPLGTAAAMSGPQDMKIAAVNGYPGSFACDRYIGNASVQGSGANAALCGKWDGNGGHQQWFFGYWSNPDLGPLYAIGNNWPRSTYPKDPGGLPLVCCWVKEADVQKAFGYHSEVYAFSHLNWEAAPDPFPPQPDVISWIIAP